VFRRLFKWITRGPAPQQIKEGTHSASVTHVIILDGTMSSLNAGREMNAGHVFKLLQEVGESPQLSVYYEPGIQWYDWRTTWDVMVGRGINRQIRRAYGYLASRYRSGDKIVLVGFSRGAYAVRSLAGMVDQIGLLQREHATMRNIRTAYRHYESGRNSNVRRAFSDAHCYPETPIEMIGVWDTVKALGLRLPLLWRITKRSTCFIPTRLARMSATGFTRWRLMRRGAHICRSNGRPVWVGAVCGWSKCGFGARTVMWAVRSGRMWRTVVWRISR